VLAAASAAASIVTGGDAISSAAVSGVPLTLAVSDYDHVRDLVDGRVPVAGADLTCLTLDVEEIFFRFTQFREWDVSELSLAKYCALRSRGDDSLRGIPVFPSRVFRHSAFFVRPDGPVDDPGGLRGGRIGIPEWTVTATVYGRAILAHEYGVGLGDVTWVQGGTNQPGRIETLEVELPAGVTVERVADRSLNDLLLAGEIDAILAPHPPLAFSDGRIVHLFSDVRSVEEAAFRRTGVFPIMHLIVLRADVDDAHPWLAANLVTAFAQARDRSVARVHDANASRFPVMWRPRGDDGWPYGVEPNRTTLDAFLGFAHEQGVCARRMDPDALFAERARATFRV
jgi:4,5-dihydroxyphthalate decarboxylase